MVSSAKQHTEQSWFVWLCRKYVQRADARQRALGLQYTEAETHDLAKEIACKASRQPEIGALRAALDEAERTLSEIAWQNNPGSEWASDRAVAALARIREVKRDD